MRVTLDYYGDYDVPFGGSTDFIEVNSNEYLSFVAHFPGFNKTAQIWVYNFTSNVIYIRGDIGSPFDFSFDTTSINLEQLQQQPANPPVVSVPPVDVPAWTCKIRFINGLNSDYYYTLTISNQSAVVHSISTKYISEYEYFFGSAGYYTVEVQDPYENSTFGVDVFLENSQSYTLISNSYYGIILVQDFPNIYSQDLSYVQVVYNVDHIAFIDLFTDRWGWQKPYVHNGDYSPFSFSPDSYGGLASISVYSDNFTVSNNFFMPNGTATTIYILGSTPNVGFYIDTKQLPVPMGPLCTNGVLESNGVCNCFSGFYSDNSSPYKCNVPSPSYCTLRNQSDALSNDFVPYMNWWATAQVNGNQLFVSILSELVKNRRTLIELPNPQCNFLNSPQYYQMTSQNCQDRFDIQFPFVECGFTKVSTPYEDFYKGTVHVKQIDQVTVGGMTTERVIDTPFPISIRMPKQLAVESYVQVFGPPSLAIDAAFVGQTVSTETQSGDLQYVSGVQYPLQIEAVQLVDLPYGVYAWVELVNVNCTDFGPCVQRLEVHINTTSCQISGTYRMVVSLSCRSDQGCPDEAKNGTQAFIESRIVSQSLCSEVGVDIDLNGYIQAYTDATFSSPALAFYPGQSAYFMINAYSSRVSLSKVTLESVYYYGPNINFQYLFFNGNQTDIAMSSNFVSGSMGSSQAWFGLDVSVSTPQSGDNTLFKLYQGQNGVYNFVAVVDVEWFVANSSSSVTPVGPPVEPSNQPTDPGAPFTFKKRMALQGSVSNQGSQFTAQVQIAGPTPSSQQPPQQQQQQTPVVASKPDDKPVSSGVSLIASWLVFFVMFVTL